MNTATQHDAHVDAHYDQRQITVTGKLIRGLCKAEFARGHSEGMIAGAAEKTSLEFGDDFSSCSAVYLIRAKSRRALSAEVAKRNSREDTGCGADCTGRAFAWSCDLLRAYREGGEWVGVCVGRTYYDV